MPDGSSETRCPDRHVSSHGRCGIETISLEDLGVVAKSTMKHEEGSRHVAVTGHGKRSNADIETNAGGLHCAMKSGLVQPRDRVMVGG
jgi:hypothetical protein